MNYVNLFQRYVEGGLIELWWNIAQRIKAFGAAEGKQALIISDAAIDLTAVIFPFSQNSISMNHNLICAIKMMQKNSRIDRKKDSKTRLSNSFSAIYQTA